MSKESPTVAEAEEMHPEGPCLTWREHDELIGRSVHVGMKAGAIAGMALGAIMVCVLCQIFGKD